MKVGITGGTGSLGSALVRWLLKHQMAEKIVILSRDEIKQAQLAEELGSHPKILRFFIGDVRDQPRLLNAFYGLSVVVHAAALKRVDAVAYNPIEVVKTNILGTQAVIEAACACRVPRVLVISSDKAVEPTNVYGASKNLAEHLAVGANAYTFAQGTRVSAIRYGNVLGSRGSVIPAWRRRIREGAPLPLTDPRMTRFWITMPQAIEAVWTAMRDMAGGDIFVPDLQAMALTDLAEALAPKYPIKMVGIRPGGEKLHERLLSQEEPRRTVRREGAFVIQPAIRTWGGHALGGDPVGEDFEYQSDTWPRRLTPAEMRPFLDEIS